MKRVCVLAVAVGLMALALVTGIVAAEEDISSAQLAQLAVSRMGDVDQDAQISDFNTATTSQIGYSGDANVTQTIYYDHIGNGSVIQWGESGDMPREERSLNLSHVNDSGYTWQWINGDVNQTINVRNSENVYLKQVIGGLKRILFPDPEAPLEQGTWTFCGQAVNGRGGLPLCAEKIGEKIHKGKYTSHDLYMLEYLEEYYDVFPSENNTPHVILTKWNLSQNNGNLTVKFQAHNFGKQKYNASLMLDLTQKINITILGDTFDKINAAGDNIQFRAADENLDSMIKVPDKRVINLGNFTVFSMKGTEKEVTVPLNGTNINTLKMMVLSE